MALAKRHINFNIFCCLVCRQSLNKNSVKALEVELILLSKTENCIRRQVGYIYNADQYEDDNKYKDTDN